MKSESTLAVVTGAAQGLGKALGFRLLSQGYNLAICDVDHQKLLRTQAEMSSRYPELRIAAMRCDVSNRVEVGNFRKKVVDEYQTDSIEILVNNAGIAGGSSFFASTEEHWQKTFDVCWSGVYNCTREFLPELLMAELSYIVNISSANGYWASSSQNTPLSAYSTAKFAVKGFTESLLVDSKINAKNVKPILVMLGQLATELSGNSASYLGTKQPKDMAEEELRSAQSAANGPMAAMPFAEFRDALQERYYGKNLSAPTTPTQAAQEIWEAIERGEWRIVVGPGARLLDEAVRANPRDAYDDGLVERLTRERDAITKT